MFGPCSCFRWLRQLTCMGQIVIAHRSVPYRTGDVVLLLMGGACVRKRGCFFRVRARCAHCVSVAPFFLKWFVLAPVAISALVSCCLTFTARVQPLCAFRP